MNWETGSTTSDLSAAIGTDYSERTSFFRRLSIPFSSENAAEDVDIGMRCLYQDTDILEQKCIIAARGGVAPPVDSATHSSKETARVLRQANHFSNKTAKSVIASLPEGFFTPGFDPVRLVPLEIASWGNGDLTEKFMMKIEDVDTDKDMILSSLADLIEANYSELMGCMRDVYDIDLDLSRAGMQVVSSRRKIAIANKALENGAMQIAVMHAKRERLSLAAAMAKSLKSLMDVHRAMLNDVTIGALAKAAEGASSLLFSLQNDSYGQFRALFSLKEVVRKNIITVRQKTDRALLRICSRKFAAAEYADIVRAYLILDYIAETLSVPLCLSEPSGLGYIGQGQGSGQGQGDDNLFDTKGCMEGLAQRVLRFLREDIDACLHTSVVEFLYASQHKREKAAKDMNMTEAFQPMALGDIMDLADAPLKELYALITTDLATLCFLRLCEVMTDIVHTHYLISQWHLAPFCPKNEDSLYLHRCGIDLNEISEQSNSPGKLKSNDNKYNNNYNNSDNYNNNNNNNNDSNNNNNNLTKDINLNPSLNRSGSANNLEESLLKNKGNNSNSNRFSSLMQASFPPFLSNSSTNTNSNLNLNLNLNSYKSILSNSSFNTSLLTSTSSQNIEVNNNNNNNNNVGQINEILKTKIIDEFSKSWNLGSTNRAVVCSDDVSVEASKKLLKLRGARLAVVYGRFSVDRSTLWSLVTQALIGMLSSVSLPASVSCEDYLSIVSAVTTVVKLGNEFCGNDSYELLNSLSIKSKSYFQYSHIESFQVLKLMIDSESWQKVNININDMGGILNILKKNIIISSKCKYCNNKGNKAYSILKSFIKYGNPFRVIQKDEIEKDAVKVVEKVVENEEEKDEVTVDLNNHNFVEEKEEFVVGQRESDNEDGNENNEHNSNKGRERGRERRGGGGRYVEEEAFEAFMRTEINPPPHTQTQTPLSATVVTQTGLNGLARYTGRYLQLMFLLPCIAPDIFSSLCQLYDYYFSAVYCGFVPVERQKAIKNKSKSTAAAPDKQEEFEVRT